MLEQGGIDPTRGINIRNVAEAIINPATEETLSTISNSVSQTITVRQGTVVIDAGGATIGTVTIGALPSGSNLIGSVSISGNVSTTPVANQTVTILSAIPAGSNTIGTVTIGALSSGGNTIGTVTIGSLSAGSNQIGTVQVSSLPNITIGAAIPSGSNQIGSVSVVGTVPVSIATGSGTVGVNNFPTNQAIIGTITVSQGTVVISGNQVVSGTVTVSQGTVVISNTPSITGTVSIGQGTVVLNSAIPAGSNLIGSVSMVNLARTLSGGTITVGQGTIVLDTGGNTIGTVTIYSPPQNFISGAITLTDTSTTAIISAGGSGVRNYITSVSASNTSATNVTIDFKDGQTVVLSFFLAASGGGATHSMPVPIKGTANTAFNARLSGAVTDVRVSAQGYKTT